MTPERERLVEAAFKEALRAPPSERGAIVRARCGSDAELSLEVRALLSAHEIVDGPLESPPPELSTFDEAASLMPPGGRIAHYQVLSVLGVGGMGVVYLAQQVRPSRTIALKVIRPGFASSTAVRRFEFEAELLGRLQHPGIAQIIEAGTADTGAGPQPYFAMELVEGRPLVEYCREKLAGVRDRIELVLRVCDAVEHAHQRGVIHRDLKPANILVDQAGQPKVLDFGVARATGAREGDHRLTMHRTGDRQLIGTLAYMSPEQVSGGPDDVDTRADVYALGVILYELLSGSLPHEVEHLTLPDAIRVIRDQDPKRLGGVDRALRGDLETITGKAIERDSARRYASVAELAADLRRYLDHLPISARPPSAVYQLRKLARRNKGLVAGLGVAVLALAAGGVAAVTKVYEAEAARRRADENAQLAKTAQAAAELAAEHARNDAAYLDRVNHFYQSRVINLMHPFVWGPSATIVDAMLDAAPHIGEDFGENPLQEARARTNVGTQFRMLRRFDSSIEQLQLASPLFRQALGEHHPDSINNDNWLGLAYQDAGRLDEAERCLRSVLARAESAEDGDEWQVTLVQWQLGTVLLDLGKLSEAEQMLRAALARTIVPLDARPLWRLLDEEGRTAEGDDLLREEHDRAAVQFPDDVAYAALTYAEQLIEQGRPKDAATVLGRYAAGQDSSPKAFRVRQRLGEILREMPGGHDRALETFMALQADEDRTPSPASDAERQAFDDQRKWTRIEIIRTLIEMERLDEARAMLDAATNEPASPSDTRRTSDPSFRLRRERARLLLAEGDVEGALRTARDYRLECIRRFGSTFSTSLFAIRLESDVLARRGELDEIDDLCREVCDEQEALLGGVHPDVVELRRAAAETLLAHGLASGGARRLCDAIDSADRIFGASSRQATELRIRLAATRADARRDGSGIDGATLDRAAATLARGVEACRTNLGDSSPRTMRLARIIDEADR